VTFKGCHDHCLVIGVQQFFPGRDIWFYIIHSISQHGDPSLIEQHISCFDIPVPQSRLTGFKGHVEALLALRQGGSSIDYYLKHMVEMIHKDPQLILSAHGYGLLVFSTGNAIHVHDQPVQGSHEVDALLKTGNNALPENLIPRLQEALKNAGEVINELRIPVLKKTAEPTKDFDSKAVTRLIQELLNMLDEDNPAVAEPVINRLTEYIALKDMVRISKAIDDFDFDQAKAQTKRLAEKFEITSTNIGGNLRA